MRFLSRIAPPRRALLAGVAAALLLAATACGSDDNGGSPSDVTTGTVDRLAPSTTAAGAPSTTSGSDPELAGLWVASPVGITDEAGNRFATPGTDETLRDPVDDQAGGVFYLRCAGGRPNCTIEHSVERNGTPTSLTEATELFGYGMYQNRPVLLTAWNVAPVPTTTPTDGALKGRIVDAESGQVQGPFDWYLFGAGPFTADVQADKFVFCVGSGETCRIGVSSAPDVAAAPLGGTDPATVTSLALDANATHLAWVETAPMTDGVTLHLRDMATGSTADTPLRPGRSAPVDDAVTDGSWVAVREGENVQLREVAAGGRSGTRQVPGDTRQIAIRNAPSGGGASSPL